MEVYYGCLFKAGLPVQVPLQQLCHLNDECLCFLYEHSDCELIAHEQCLENVKRNCVAVLVDRNPTFIMKICPEGSLSAQDYKCEECRNKLSFSKLLAELLLANLSCSFFSSLP